MTGHIHHAIFPVLIYLATFFATAPPARPGDDVFVERFEQTKRPARWNIETTLQPPSLQWHGPGEDPGFHFKSVAVKKYIKSHAYAWSQWDVGTEPFELSWEVRMDRALKQRWFYPGVAVGLTSAPPEEMGKDDIAVCFGVHMGGMAASVRKGGFYNLIEKGRGAYSNFRDRVLSNLIDRSSGGTASVDWPMKHPGGHTIKFRIKRLPDNTVKFTIFWPELRQNDDKPFWSGEWKMPENIAEVPFRYVSVKRMPVENVHVSYAGFVMKGIVRDIQGRLLSSPPAPIVENYLPQQPVLSGGARLTLEGHHFQKKCRVLLGGKEAGDIRVDSSKKLTCILPDLPTGKYYPLTVINRNGLSGTLKGGVPYGRMVEEFRPREALPRGGDVVTAVGAGFEKNTVFSFNGKKAEIIEIKNAARAQIRVPPGETGQAEVRVKTGEKKFAGTPLFGYSPHPYLYFSAEDLPDLREKFKDPMFRHYRALVLRHARKNMEEKPQGNLQAISLAFAYALTEKETYKERAIKSIRKGWSATESSDFAMMGVTGMAIAYDILFRELSPKDRASFQDYLDRMISGYLKDAGGSWFLGAGPNFSNTVPVGNSGGMLAGLALLHSTPDAKKAVDIAAKKAKRYPDECITPDGGCREGAQYWDYGCSFHLILAHALNNATGDDRGLLEHPHLKNMGNFVRTQLGGNGGMFAFNDNREPWLGGYAICADIGSRYDQPLMLWIADLCVKGGETPRLRGVWAPFAFLWRDKQPSPDKFPGVPTLAYLKSIHWGAIRSDTSFKPDLVVGFKGSRGPLTHHKQKDLGSYVLHANGEVYLLDPGYYEGKATDHTLPLVDGKGPGVRGSRVTMAHEKGPWRHVVLDSTEGYRKAAQRVRRLLVMHGTDYTIVFDDILPAKNKPGKITAQYQTAWKPELPTEQQPARMLVAGQNGKLFMEIFGHALKLSAKDRKFSSGWHWAKVDESGPGDWHTVSGEYTADLKRPLITVLTPGDADANRPSASCNYSDDKITINPGSGPKVVFRLKDGLWHFQKP
ncbi:MAG: IPT/TIG domain-containing protein [Candidatus Brocadiia bacterium]